MHCRRFLSKKVTLSVLPCVKNLHIIKKTGKQKGLFSGKNKHVSIGTFFAVINISKK